MPDLPPDLVLPWGVMRFKPGTMRVEIDQLKEELARTDADLTVAVQEATRARGELRSEHATNAELRRQLAGTGALLAAATAQRRAVLDLCDDMDRHYSYMVATSEVRAALGAAGTGRIA